MSDSSFCTGTGRVMLPGFQTAYSGGPCILFLFEGWVVDSATKYAFVVLAAFAMGLSNEGFAFARRLLSRSLRNRPRAMMALLGVVYGAHMVIAYWMMLLVMTYESVVFSALILGLATGHAVSSVLSAPTEAQLYSNDGWKNANEPEEELAAGTPCCGGSQHVSST